MSFVIIQQPWKFQEETIVNVRFADSAFDMKGQSLGNTTLSKNDIKSEAVVAQDVTLQASGA